MLIIPDEQEVTNALDVHTLWRVRNKLYKDSGPTILGKFLRVQRSEACSAIPYNYKEKVLHLPFPSKKKVQIPVGHFWSWRQHISYLGILAMTHLLGNMKGC